MGDKLNKDEEDGVVCIKSSGMRFRLVADISYELLVKAAEEGQQRLRCRVFGHRTEVIGTHVSYSTGQRRVFYPNLGQCRRCGRVQMRWS